MDTLKCCVLCAMMWNAELTCVDLKEKLPKVPLKREKEKYHSYLLVFISHKKMKSGN